MIIFIVLLARETMSKSCIISLLVSLLDWGGRFTCFSLFDDSLIRAVLDWKQVILHFTAGREDSQFAQSATRSLLIAASRS